MPTEADICEYATFLGIAPDTEQDLMWIAVEGVSARLPVGWRPCSTRRGQVYYYNVRTGASSWTHPRDVEYKQQLAEERARRSMATREAPTPTPTPHYSERREPDVPRYGGGGDYGGGYGGGGGGVDRRAPSASLHGQGVREKSSSCVGVSAGVSPGMGGGSVSAGGAVYPASPVPATPAVSTPVASLCSKAKVC